jgi:cytoskeletal protein RodZ
MAETNDNGTPAAGGAKDKVGDILRKERLTRRITVETIAKDLKLNVAYIKALEASEYESLPADPYVRVYIKSLTKYLSLDTDGIMKEFYKERGLIADDHGGSKIDVSVQKQEKNPTVILVAALVVILAVFAFIANQKGWISTENMITTTTFEEPADAPDGAEGLAQEASEDSVLAAMNNPDTAAAAAKRAPRP